MGKIPFCLVLLFLLADAACTKSGDMQNKLPVDSTKIFGSIDSSDLIKGITYQSDDSTYTQYFYYDTVSRKIIVSLQPVSSSSQDYTDGEEYSYDAYGMLVHISGKFLDPQDTYFSKADYQYDDQHVLKSVSYTFFGGFEYTANYAKSPVPAGGYMLYELYTSPGNNGYTDSSYVGVYFSDSGTYISSYQIHNDTEVGSIYNTSVNGDTYFYTTDTAIYDAAGNFSKSIFTTPPDPLKADSLVTYTRFEFKSRDTKGSQLFNLGRVLYNGVGNTMIFSIIDSYAWLISPLGDDGIQMNKHPALQATMTVADSFGNFNTVLTFNTPAQYDDKSRLIKYHNFARFAPYAEYDILIAYYK
jgi:hypothetical protein